MQKIIVGIHGKARSGKSTLAAHLVSIWGFSEYFFAKPLKDALCALFGWDERHTEGELKEVEDPQWGLSPRQAMQIIGTDCYREMIDKDFWVKVAKRFMSEAPYVDKNKIVIADIRFENEARFVREEGGLIVHIHRDNRAQVAQHISESGIGFLPDDLLINNDSDFENVYHQFAIGYSAFLKRRNCDA